MQLPDPATLTRQVELSQLTGPGGESTIRKLHIQTASKASDWTLRHTSSPIYYSDPLVDHERLRAHGVTSIFMPRYGGSQIDVQDWAVASQPVGGSHEV